MADRTGSTSLPPVFKFLYAKYDTNGDGRIDSREFAYICDVLGYHLSSDEVELAMKTLDSDGSGTLSFDDLHAWWSSSTRRHEVSFSEEELLTRKRCADAFDYFDKDKNSGCTAARRIEGPEIAEFYDYLIQHSVIQELSLADMMKDMDVNNDGSISFKEYIHFLEDKNYIPHPGDLDQSGSSA